MNSNFICDLGSQYAVSKLPTFMRFYAQNFTNATTPVIFEYLVTIFDCFSRQSLLMTSKIRQYKKQKSKYSRYYKDSACVLNPSLQTYFSYTVNLSSDPFQAANKNHSLRSVYPQVYFT